jgi:threonine dehydrogenase-like Zn-dependent dehydrogenase
MSTGFSGAERGNIRIGDTVAVFAQGPIGLCATAGAKLSGATTVIGVDRLASRLEIARRMGADHVIDASRNDPLDEIMRLTGGRGVDVAIEALGTQVTLCPGGKRRMRRLMSVIQSGRVDLGPMVTSLQARRDRDGLPRVVRSSTRRRAEGRYHAVTE